VLIVTKSIGAFLLTVSLLTAATTRAQTVVAAPDQSDGSAPPRSSQPTPVDAPSPWVQPTLASTEYRIGPDDLISVTVLQASELNASVRVSETGDISLPLLGMVRAADLTTAELELRLEDRLREKYIRNPDVTVRAVEIRSHGVAVVGAVRHAGVVQIPRAAPLLDVISLAGGLADDAGDSVLIMRKPAATGVEASGTTGTVREVIPLKALMQSQPAANVAIHPGDVVNVQSAAVVYVVGAVNKPGAFAMRGNDRLTVLRAVALGEGVTSVASTQNALVLRTRSGGERTEIPIDLRAVLKGTAPDIALEPQDLLFVPTNGGKVATRAMLDYATRLFTFRVIP
jgi:polysaccharide export outer membrane protein